MTTVRRSRRGGTLGFLKVSGSTIQVSYKVLNQDLGMLTDCGVATNLATHMGLLPEIDRVWIAIDHNLFLWDYVDGCVSTTRVYPVRL